MTPKQLTQNDIFGMCKYLKGDESTVYFHEKFPISNSDKGNIHLENEYCKAGVFTLKAKPEIITDYIKEFADKKPGGQTIVKLSDPMRDKLYLATDGYINYLCFTFAPPKHDVIIFEKVGNTLTLIEDLGSPSGHFTIFIPIITSMPTVALIAYMRHTELGIVGIIFAYDRYPEKM